MQAKSYRLPFFCALTLLLCSAPAWLLGQANEPQAPAAPSQQTAQTPQEREPGLYLTFETSMGSIECKLFEKETPMTVRKIVGLATGRLPYVDPKTKQRVTGRRLYDGLTFHRVIPRFMIQGGDPLGTGEGGPEGPGFPFKDEVVPGLGFDVPGRLALANAGPNTNQSQFFITEVPTPYLNGKHTIFGQCENLDVVRAIARVPADSDQPLKPVIIKRAVVKRVGAPPPDAGKPSPR